MQEPRGLRPPGRAGQLWSGFATLAELIEVFGPPDTGGLEPAWVIRVWHWRGKPYTDVALYPPGGVTDPERDAAWVIAGDPAERWAAQRVVLAIRYVQQACREAPG